MKEQYWNILSKTTDWIKFADTKAVVILTVYGIIITIIYSNAAEVYNFLSQTWIFIILSSISTIFGAISIGYSFSAINPKIKNDNPNSLIYFGHIQEKYYNDLSDALKENENIEIQISEQIYSNSKIAWKKYRNVSISIKFFVASIALVLIELVLYFLTR